MSIYAEAHLTALPFIAPMAADPNAPAGGGEEVKNPLDGVTPNLGVFGEEFNSQWTIVAAGIWALALVVVVIALGKALVEYSLARRRGHMDGLSEAGSTARQAAIGLAGLVGLPIIVSAVIAVMG